MRKNKITLGIAMVLIAALLLPAVSAFSVFGLSQNNIYFILVNTAIIGFILFVGQSLLIGEKPGKEKTVVWLVVVIASLILAWNYGNSNYIWKSGPISYLFDFHVLGNSLIITAILYLILAYLKVNEKIAKSPQGTAGYVVLLFAASVLIAIKLAGNQWLWNIPIAGPIYSYLFVKDSTGYGGILNPFGPDYRMFVLIGSMVVFSWFFLEYLKIGAQNKLLAYAMALIIAANLASNGVSTNTIIKVSEIFTFLILGTQLSANFTKKWVGWVIAAVLVIWISHILFGDRGVVGGAIPVAKGAGILLTLLVMAVICAIAAVQAYNRKYKSSAVWLGVASIIFLLVFGVLPFLFKLIGGA